MWCPCQITLIEALVNIGSVLSHLIWVLLWRVCIQTCPPCLQVTCCQTSTSHYRITAFLYTNDFNQTHGHMWYCWWADLHVCPPQHQYSASQLCSAHLTALIFSSCPQVFSVKTQPKLVYPPDSRLQQVIEQVTYPRFAPCESNSDRQLPQSACITASINFEISKVSVKNTTK